MTPLLGALTPREEEVIALIAEGLTHREIAYCLDITTWTVRAHRGNAVRKLRASSTEHAVAMFVRSRVTAA